MKLIQDDCLTYLKSCNDNVFDMVMTSPPYDNIRSYGDISCWNQSIWIEILKELYRTVKKGGVVVWVTNDSTVGGGETLSSFKQAIDAQSIGFLVHDTMIWKKTNFSNPSSTRYHQTFEYMFVFSKGKPKTFNPIMDRQNIYAGKIGSYGKNTVTQRDGSKKERPRKINSDFGMRHNVWEMKTSGQTGESKAFHHPAMFPLQLAKDHVISWSNEGDVVLDPFMGSGTTGQACMELKRQFVGIEINKEYFDIAYQRLIKEGSH